MPLLLCHRPSRSEKLEATNRHRLGRFSLTPNPLSSILLFIILHQYVR